MRFALIAILLAGCAAVQPRSPSSIRVDHVILGVSDLDKGIADLERITGVRSEIGGVHPGQGTRNALMSLGDGTYLEIVAPDPAQSIDNETTRELRALVSLKPIGWAVSADSEDTIRSALAKAGIATSATEPGSRAKPDGSILRWITFEYKDFGNPLAPFFIIWASPDLHHPSKTSPAGCRLTHVRIASRDATSMTRAVAPLELGVSVDESTGEQMQLSLSCPKGDVTL